MRSVFRGYMYMPSKKLRKSADLLGRAAWSETEKGEILLLFSRGVGGVSLLLFPRAL